MARLPPNPSILTQLHCMNETMTLELLLPETALWNLETFPFPSRAWPSINQNEISTICGSDIRAIYREHVGKGRRDTRQDRGA
jgi:hypothetical protein